MHGKELSSLFDSNRPKFPDKWDQFLANPFFMFILCLPMNILHSIYCHSNSSSYERYDEPQLSLDSLLKIIILWLQKRGSTQPSSVCEFVLTQKKYHSMKSIIKLNELSDPQYANESMDAYTHRSSLCTIRFCQQYSTHTSQMFSFVKVAVADETSMGWIGKEREGAGSPHNTKNPNKVHPIAFQAKCLNDYLTGVRLAMFPVLSLLESSKYREDFPFDTFVKDLSSAKPSS